MVFRLEEHSEVGRCLFGGLEEIIEFIALVVVEFIVFNAWIACHERILRTDVEIVEYLPM